MEEGLSSPSRSRCRKGAPHRASFGCSRKSAGVLQSGAGLSRRPWYQRGGEQSVARAVAAVITRHQRSHSMRSITAFSFAALLMAAPAFAQGGYTGSASSSSTASSANDAQTSARQAADAAQRARISAEQATQAARSVNSPAADSAARAAQEAAAAAQAASQAASRAAAITGGGSQSMSSTATSTMQPMSSTTTSTPQGTVGSAGRALGGTAVTPTCPPGYVYEPGVPGRTIARVDECVPAGSATAKEVVPRPGSGVGGQSNNQIN
jgi:hypothetical protein